MASFAAIKAVLENGVVILPLDYYGVHNKKQKTGMIAAPIQIGEDKYICVVEVIDNLALKRLYVHESFLTKNLYDALGPNPVHQSNDTSSHSINRDSIANVLKNFIISQSSEEKNTDNSENNIITENKQYKMRQTIRKSDLKRLVENTLNELDCKTYMNAARKRDAQGMSCNADNLRYHAADQFDKSHGTSGAYLKDNGFEYDKDGRNYVWDDDLGGGYWENGEYHDNYDIPVTEPHFEDAWNYYNDGSEYEPGRGWTNESRNRRLVDQITESVIRRLNGRRVPRRR